jgi:hypothetical protein
MLCMQAGCRAFSLADRFEARKPGYAMQTAPDSEWVSSRPVRRIVLRE